MYPQIDEKITLFTLSTRGQVWVVRGEATVVVEDVEVIDNHQVRLVATVCGRQFECKRPFNPTTLDELRTSVWRPIISGRPSPCPDHLFVEAVTAFNVHRELGKKPEELVCNRSLKSVLPHSHNAYCATHDRAHYWDDCCPKCASASVSTKPEIQAA
jgi:hypothetical protein